MLVSEIGYLNLNSKNLPAAELNNNIKQQTKTNLSEGFGNVNDLTLFFSETSDPLSRFLGSLKTFFTPKKDESKKYMNMIA